MCGTARLDEDLEGLAEAVEDWLRVSSKSSLAGWKGDGEAGRSKLSSKTASGSPENSTILRAGTHRLQTDPPCQPTLALNLTWKTIKEKLSSFHRSQKKFEHKVSPYIQANTASQLARSTENVALEANSSSCIASCESSIV